MIKNITKRYFLIGILAIAVVAFGVHVATAAVTYEGLEFSIPVTTTGGKTYYLDTKHDSENTKERTNGAYDLSVALGFYGEPNLNDPQFISEIDRTTTVRVLSKGTTNSLGMLRVYGLKEGEKVAQGEVNFYWLSSSTGGFTVNPGEYTIETLSGSQARVVQSFDICLSSFTTSTGVKIGNVNCDTVPPPASTMYPGEFVYDNAGPGITCSKTAGTCTFTQKITGQDPGDIAIYPKLYPVADFDKGGSKSISLLDNDYTVDVRKSKGYTASIVIPLSELTPKMDATEPEDRNYYIEFNDKADPNHKSNKKKFDFSGVIPVVGSAADIYAGEFVFDNAGPTITCSASAGTCTFTQKITGQDPGDIALYLNMYPVADVLIGGTKGFSVNGFNYTTTIQKNKTHTATITVPYNEFITKMNAMQVADRKYYVEFQDIADPNHKSNRKNYDFETLIPMSAGAKTNATFEVSSVLAPTTTVTIKGTLAASGSVSVDSKLDLYIWPAVGGTPQKMASTDMLTINSGGVSFVIEKTGLTANTKYNYRFVIAATEEIAYENVFSTNVSGDQAVTGAAGVCGGTVNGKSLPSAPAEEAILCDVGTPTAVSGTGPWTWSCLGTGGGVDAPCKAESLASGAGGAACGSANDGSFSVAPGGSSLCAAGSASAVSTTNEGWKWVCTVDSDQKNCTAKKVVAQEAEDPNAITSKNLLQNPFKTLDSFPKIIKAVMNNIILPIAVPFVAVMLIYSGFLFIVARKDGNVYNLAKAKQTLVYTLIGAVLTLGAFVIANALQGTLNSIISTHYEQSHDPRV